MKPYVIIILILIVGSVLAVGYVFAQPSDGAYDNKGVFHPYRPSPYAFAVPRDKILDDAIYNQLGGLVGWRESGGEYPGGQWQYARDITNMIDSGKGAYDSSGVFHMFAPNICGEQYIVCGQNEISFVVHPDGSITPVPMGVWITSVQFGGTREGGGTTYYLDGLGGWK